MNYYNIQLILFLFAALISIILLIVHTKKKGLMKGLFMAILPILIYFFINFVIEAILFGTWLYINASNLSTSVFHIANKNLSLCDLKIIFVLIALIGWFYLYSKNDKGL